MIKSKAEFGVVLLGLLIAACGSVSTRDGYTLGAGETNRGYLIITSGQATLEEDSLVTGPVIMTSGELDVYGEVDDDIIFTSGRVTLHPGSVVNGDIMGTSGNLNRLEGSTIRGQSGAGFGGFFTRVFFILCLLPCAFIALILALLFVLPRRRRSAAQAPIEATTTEDYPDVQAKLRQLKEMLDEGLITEEEYQEKKSELLAGI